VGVDFDTAHSSGGETHGDATSEPGQGGTSVGHPGDGGPPSDGAPASESAPPGEGASPGEGGSPIDVVAPDAADGPCVGVGCPVCQPGTGSCIGNIGTSCMPDGGGYVSVTCDLQLGERCDGTTGRCTGD
jgi:hypothetical protein